MKRRQLAALVVASLALLGLGSGQGFAQSSSPNYKVQESFFGTGGENATSTNYSARQAAGELTVGNSASANYQFQAGFNTTDVPLLEFAVNGGIFDLGILDPSITGTVTPTPTFTVRSYLSSGYVVLLRGSPPSNNTGQAHTLTAMSSPLGSSPGTEQFGVNLVNNSNPDTGADPVQVPNSTFSFGAAVSGYDTANLFKFVDGDTIAFSNKSSGQTTYTLAVIANVARETPAGEYGGQLNIQVIPTF